ncbi:Fc.00g011130.m01.CDS01 [Cosmosporella sp. VM-42]
MNTYLVGKAELQNLRDGPKPSALSSELDQSVITDLLIGIHAAAAIEVLKFAKRLGIDAAILRDIVKDAAGSSVMFDKVCVQLQGKSDTSLKSIDDFESISHNLASAIEVAKQANYPLFFAAAALQQLFRS